MKCSRSSVAVPTPPLTISDVVLKLTKDSGPKSGEKHSNGHPRRDLYFAGSLVLVVTEKIIPVGITVHLVSNDGSIAKNRGKFYISAKVNKNPNAVSTALARLPRENRPAQHCCPVCTGNRGRSGPEYDGKTAELLAEAVFPVVNRMLEGIKGVTTDETPDRLVHADHNPGGWYLLDVYGDKAISLPDGKGRGIYIALRTQLDCPVHGTITVTEYEPAI